METTNTWHDCDVPWGEIPNFMKENIPGMGFLPPTHYGVLAERARDGFKFVIKVSHVATHTMKLDKPEEWWPPLYKMKYKQLEFANCAYSWQFAPTFKCTTENLDKLE